MENTAPDDTRVEQRQRGRSFVSKQDGEPMADPRWQDIADDREKYAAYLCSREWSILKEAVKKRSGGLCERCRVVPGSAVHHLTYIRQYHENLDDLQHICSTCHRFTHGKSDVDPSENRWWFFYVSECISCRENPVPFCLAELGWDGDQSLLQPEIAGPWQLSIDLNEIRKAAVQEALSRGCNSPQWHYFLSIETSMMSLDRKLGFCLSTWIVREQSPVSKQIFDQSLSIKWPLMD